MKVRMRRRRPLHGSAALLMLLALCVAPPLARRARAQQRAVARRDANVRAGQSRAANIVARLRAGDTVIVVRPQKVQGYYDIRTAAATATGWVYAPLLRVLPGSTAPALPPGPPLNVPGSSAFAGCGDGRWRHVYHPARLIIKQPCVTVTGTIVDATGGREPDGVRHESDGDTHGWLRLDPPFAAMLAPANQTAQRGNLVFELVCHFQVRQLDAQSACAGFRDTTAIPRVGTHVQVTGTWVMDSNHENWNEIHPVTRIRAVP